ncbi:MAG: alpha/beta hydrolase [Mycobacterium sp.]|uniref:alpha/beta hydrolase n=1 Tax=Mycobacterium sp. TaxID=1785 RepID=UPI0026091F11|nr:alpha/beta hydrolase [Mycobacterium sp.]MDI3312730.1 alpha/beta hydrolase [Mycobacterium sp.]
MPAVSGGLPPLAGVRFWSVSPLLSLAADLEAKAERCEACFSEAYTVLSAPGWKGAFRDTTVERAAIAKTRVDGAADQLRETADTARRGAERIRAAKKYALEKVNEAEREGFEVGEDYSVTDTRRGGSEQQRAARAQQAAVLRADIRHRVALLVAADREVGEQVIAASAGLAEFGFPEDVPGTGGDQHAGPASGATDMSSGDITAIDKASRGLLDQLEREYRALPDGQIKTDRLADIAGIRSALQVPDSHLLYLARPDDPSQMIPAAVAIGDPFTADHVSVTVPGVSGTTREALATMTQEAYGLRREAQGIAGKVGEKYPSVSTIAWTGYQPPPTLVSGDTPFADLAHAGALRLESFLANLNSASHNPNHTTALFGHSYGSLVSGIALKDGASSAVTNAVMYGSPGFEATSPAKLGMTDHNFFVMTAPDDPIRLIAATAPLHGWGADPNDIIDGPPVPRYRFTHLQTEAGWVHLGGENIYESASHGHGGYPHDPMHQMTGFNLAAVLLNRPDLTVQVQPHQ